MTRRQRFLGVLLGLLAVSSLGILLVGSWESVPSPEEVSAARDRLRRPLVPTELGRALRDCLDRLELHHVEVVTDAARIVVREATPVDSVSNMAAGGDVESCLEDVERLFPEYFGAPQLEPRTREEFYAIYELLLAQAACLADQGHQVSTPDFQSFLSEGGTWLPYEDVPPPREEDAWEALNRVCPQTPWAYERRQASSATDN